ncbi:MAG TPA: alkaline phosphatase family protein [Candidatus Eisenbacteria bacterium]|nr:alkaline phosphatase family protein [Candidatus Eisenbacteria bacterium]
MSFRPGFKRPLHTALAFLVLFAVGIGVWTCAGAGEKSRNKVLLIGMDAGEWDVMGPLLDQQKLPAFATLRAQGASGRLRSLEPLTKSPIIWASIATGKVPEKHGISDFFVKRAEKSREAAKAAGEEGDAPTTSNLWRARPVWDIVGSLGKRVGVIGWWTTWPAQQVNGWMVSDYVQYDDGSWPAKDARRTYPESLDSLVQAMRRTPQSVSWAELFQFVAPIDTTKVTQRQKDLLQDLRWIYAADMTFYRVGMHLYKTHKPEFMTVYFRGVDAASHRYWDIDIPGSFNPPLTDAEYQWMRTLIPNYYVFTDRLIGNFMKEADSNTNVVVCSDHGFMGGGKGVMAHKLDGIVFMKGPGVKKGVTIAGATVLDVTPTVLTLFGLPTAQDMDGRPIEDALTSGTMKKIARDTRLKTYETAARKPGGEAPIASPVDEELRERLRSLGYIQ